MEERQAYVDRELDRMLRQWSARTALLGAAIFLALSVLDFSCVPELAVRFFAYRLVVATILTVSAALIRRVQRRAAMLLLIFLAVLASAVALQAMIMEFGRHHSPYLIGLILLAVVVAGLIPSGAGFFALLSGTIFVVYLAPLLLWDTISEPVFFVVRSVLFLCILIAGVMIRWFHWRHIVDEISLRHQLTLSREKLELEVAQHAQTGAELHESREFLASITTAALDAIAMIDHEGVVRFWNPAAERIFGYRAAEAVGRGPFTFLIAPDKSESLLAGYRDWQRTGASPLVGHRIASRGLRKDGTEFPLEIALAAVPRGGHNWACVLLTDISDRVRNEERLNLFAAAVEAAAEGIFIVDLDGKIVFCNSAAGEQFGYPVAELIGRHGSSLHQDPATVTGVIYPALHRDGCWAGEVPCVRRDGRTVHLWLVASLVRNAKGFPVALVGLTRDLADQKKLEAEHLRTQKIESVGVLAGGLAHDFNNLLTIILGNLDLARLFAGANPDAAEALDHASEAAMRAGDLTRQLITFSKGGQPVKRVGSIVRTVRDTVLFAATGSNLACEFAIAEDLPAVDYDEGQIRQVIHNFVQNAREAMPGGGTLKVNVCSVRLADGDILPLTAGRYLRLEFKDHGTGIERDNLHRIFDPYFSTKEMDTVKGRGLGLAVSYSIVRNHGGTITADSRLGEGTVITVFLPEATREVDEAEEEPSAVTATGSPTLQERLPDGPPRGRVLVMDDEPLVLEMSGAALRRLGYAATLTRSGAEAIVKYQVALDAGKRFDAVILDLTIPGGLGGPETLTRLRQIDPAVRAALSSGYVNHPSVNNWATEGFAAFIAKPYSLKAFEDLLVGLGLAAG